MNSFFQKKIITKCEDCRIKQSNIDYKKDSSLIHKQGNGDVLVVIDIMDHEDNLDYLVKELNAKGITDFQIYSPCLCRTYNFEIPSPAYSIYNHCGCLDLSQLDYKVVLCMGRALSYFIQGNDFLTWEDFSEFIFNQTYFIHNNKRVYPITFLSEWLRFDSIEKKFAIKQIGFLKEHLKEYTPFIVKPYNIVIVDDVDDFLNYYKNLACEMAWDTETSSLNHFDEDFSVGCLTLTFDGDTGYYLPFKKINRRLLSQFFKTKYQITANGKYDVKAMLVSGVQNSRVDEDVTLLAHLLNTTRVKNGLKTLAWLIGQGGYDNTLDKYIKQNKCKNYLDVPEKVLSHYAVTDAIVTYRVYKYLMNDLVPKQQCIYDTYKKYVIPVIKVFTKAEMRGMDIDIEYLNKLNIEVDNEINECKDKILKQLNMDIDINSPKQLGEALEKIGLPEVERAKKIGTDKDNKDKKGRYKTGVEQLEYWKREGLEVADDLLKYRELMKLKTTYLGSYNDNKTDDMFFKKQDEDNDEGLAKYIRNGKVHATFNPARTDSLRSNCDSPNLQQVPKQGESGKRIRPIFKCPDNYYICEVDQSGFQLRIAAIFSGDPTMKDIFLNKGGDLHSITAQGVFARDKTLEYFLEHKHEEPYKSLRFKAKGVGFRFLFLGTAYGFKSDIESNWTDNEVDEYIKENNLEVIKDKNENEDRYLTVATDIRNKFFQTYPKLEQWGKQSIIEAKRLGYKDCMLGGRRHLPLMTFYDTASEIRNQKEKSHFESVAVNTDVQTFEALIMYKAMVEIDNEIEKNRLKSIIVGMIHDSIVGYIHQSEVEQMYHIIKNAMDDYKSFDIPLVSDVSLGQIWGFSEEINEKNLKNFI